MSNYSKVISDIERTVNEASCHYEIWWSLGSADRKRFSMVIENEPFSWFLESTSIAHLMAMLMALGRLFDPSARTSSVRSLKRILRDENLPELADEIETTFRPLDELIRRILDIRCKIVAHTDSDTTDEEVLKGNPFTPG